MPLSPEQIAQMDAALSGQPSLTPEMMAEMDSALSSVGEKVGKGGAGKAFTYGFNRLIPFGNEISSQLAATAVAPFVPETRQELVDQARQHTEETMQAHPFSSGAGTVAGIAATLPAVSAKAITGAASTEGIRGAVNAIPKGLSAIDRFVRSGKAAKDAGMLAKAGSLALRSAKGAAVAAPSAGLYAAGEAAPGQRGEAFKSGAGMGAGVGAALPVAGAALGAAAAGTARVYKGLKARDVEALEAAGQAIKQRSSLAYQAMRDSGATFKPGATNKIIQNMQQQLTEDGILNSRLHKKIIDLFEDFKQEALDQNITLEGLDQWRQLFGQVAGEFTDKVNARKALLLKNSLDDAINDLPDESFSVGGPEALQALRTARTEWARQSKFNQIADIIEGSGGDANKLKRDLERFRLNPKKTRGWSKDELAALKFASSQTTGEGVMKLVGKFGFDLGSGRAVGNTALPVLGGISTGLAAGSIGPGMLIPAVGTAARVGQKMLARGKAEELLNVIEQGGNVSMDMVNALPPAEKNKLLSSIMQMSPSKAALAGKLKQYIKDESGSVGRIDFDKGYVKAASVPNNLVKELDFLKKTVLEIEGQGRSAPSMRKSIDELENKIAKLQKGRIVKFPKKLNKKEGDYSSDLQKIADGIEIQSGGKISASVEASRMSESTYLSLSKENGDGIKIRISEHEDRYGGNDFNFNPNDIDGMYKVIKDFSFKENKGTWNLADPRIQMGAAGVAGGTALMSGNGERQKQ